MSKYNAHGRELPQFVDAISADISFIIAPLYVLTKSFPIIFGTGWVRMEAGALITHCKRLFVLA